MLDSKVPAGIAQLQEALPGGLLLCEKEQSSVVLHLHFHVLLLLLPEVE
jgi:hypothetical protein